MNKVYDSNQHDYGEQNKNKTMTNICSEHFKN